MKAWQLTGTDGPSSFEMAEVETPEPGEGEARVRLVASSINHLDLWASRGLPAPAHLPHIPGADGAGVVEAVGPGVDGAEVGDEVVIDPSMSCGECASCRNDELVYCRSFGILGEHFTGTLAEAIVVPARNLLAKPATMSWEVAGSFGLVTGTALRMLDRARLATGETVLIPGIGGGVSAAALHLAVARRGRVFVTSRSPDKIAWAKAQGAVDGFDSSGEFSQELRQHGGADVVVENVGPATWEQSMRSLRPGGRMVVCGGTSGAKVELRLPYLFFKQIEIIGSSMATRSQFARALHLVGSGEVQSMVDSVFPFEDALKALARLDAGGQTGKIVISRAG